MEEQLITFETAKLAKEKGFDIIVKHFFDKNGSLDSCGNENWNKGYGSTCSCSTQSLLQKWIRDKYNIHVGIDYDKNGWAYFFLTDLKKPEDVSWSENYSTYEEALEKGLQKALHEIK